VLVKADFVPPQQDSDIDLIHCLALMLIDLFDSRNWNLAPLGLFASIIVSYPGLGALGY